MTDVRCTWTAVSGVDGYNVYLKSNGEFVKQNSELITDTTYDIEGLADGAYQAYAKSVLNDVESDASNTKAFNIGIVAGHETDFSEYADTVAMKVDWESIYNAVDYELFSGTTEIGNKALDQTSMGSNARRFIRYNPQEEITGDVEVLVLISANINHYYIFLHTSGLAGSENGYFVARRSSGSSGLYIQKYTDGSYSGVQTGSKTWVLDINTYDWVRFRREGNMLKAKAWRHGESEPASWDIEAEDNSIQSGRVGIGRFTGSGIIRLDFFAVSDGETIQVPT